MINVKENKLIDLCALDSVEIRIFFKSYVVSGSFSRRFEG